MNKPKKIPMRKCVGCNESFEKRQLIRVVRNKEGEVFLDLTGKQNGRGAYLCKNVECFEKALKRKAIERALEVTLSDEIIETIKRGLNE
ncbi:RNase P modulator RnpM [Guggenheimella bovis]